MCISRWFLQPGDNPDNLVAFVYESLSSISLPVIDASDPLPYSVAMRKHSTAARRGIVRMTDCCPDEYGDMTFYATA